MKKIILAAAVLGMAAIGMQSAKAGVHFGFSIGVPAPVIIAPAPVYCPPPAPVVEYAPAYCPPPVCYNPAPVVGFRFGFGGHDRYWHREYRGGYRGGYHGYGHEYREHHGRW